MRDHRVEVDSAFAGMAIGGRFLQGRQESRHGKGAWWFIAVELLRITLTMGGAVK